MTSYPKNPGTAGAGEHAADGSAISGTAGQLERYDVRSRLAVGGMAEVYVATARGAHGFEKTVALKRILPQLALDSQFERRFIGEAKLAAKLSHANIVQVLDFGRYGGSWYIAMEYVDGVDLSHLLRKLQQGKQQLSLPAAFHIAVELLRGLEYAHQLGVVHRDISPSNILLSRSGEVKIADFGIAIATRRDQMAAEGERVIAGKWRYMSPEQAVGHDLDARSDLFSAGIVLFELFTGQRLFAGASNEEIVRNVRNGAIPLASSLRKDLPPALDDILASALQRDPQKRVSRAALMQRALTELSYQSNIVVSPDDVAEAVTATLASDVGHKSLDQIIRQQLAAAGVDANTQASQASTMRHTDIASLPGQLGVSVLTNGPTLGRDVWQPRQGDGEVTSMSLVYHLGRDGIAELAEAPVAAAEPTIAGLPRARRPSTDALRLDADPLGLVGVLDGTTTGAVRGVDVAEMAGVAEATNTADASSSSSAIARQPTRWWRPFVAIAVVTALAMLAWNVARRGEPSELASTAKPAPAPVATLQIDSQPLGAKVLIDGNPAGVTPLQWTSPTGNLVRVDMQLDGYDAYQDPAVALTVGATTRVFTRLRPAATTIATAGDTTTPSTGVGTRLRPPGPKGDVVPAVAKARRGKISLYIDDSWADVYLAGKLVGRAPNKELDLPIGQHRLVLKNPPSGRETSIDVQVDEDRVNYFRTKF